MSELEVLRLLMKQRLHAAAEEIFGLFEKTRADYEEQNQRQHKLLDDVVNPKVQLHGSDVQQLLVIKADFPPEWSPGLDHEDTDPLHIKEEQEEVWISPEGEQFNGLEEANIARFPFTPVPVKIKDEDRSSQLHQSPTQDNREAEPPASCSATQIKTETDGEDCGGSEPARNPEPDTESQPDTDDERVSDSSDTELSYDDWQKPLSDSGSETENSDRMETRAPEPAANALKLKEVPLSDERCNAGKKSFGFFKCSRRFYYKGWLQGHMKCHFGKRSSRCLVPKKCLRAKQKVDSQTRVHTGEKLSGCDVCGKVLKRKADLQRHMRIHTGEKSFGCDVCGKRFTHQSTLKRHMRVHTGEKPFGCDVCGKRFNQQSTLKTHTRIHTGEKSFGCDVCEKRFNQQSTLKRHMRIHTGEKPFGCDVCGKRFKQLAHLKTHMRIHTGEKSFGCDVCEKRFNHQSTLKRHIRVHTGEKPEIYQEGKCEVTHESAHRREIVLFSLL
ncbi:zinc finger protein 135-like [Sander lucioperca]|uniref:Zinc finger protein 135-like n=1 Tax=Sander lucioperca TaxID=283035 RepID=A0A8C9ZNB6_SANLU|nr:zinc finger protein 135-like [Sander lucioperca]